MTDRRVPCQACGTWQCQRCGWKRHGASIDTYAAGRQDCHCCGWPEGTMTPTRHAGAGSLQYASRIYYDHNPVIGPLCSPDWYRYVPERPCGHGSCRGIRVPGAAQPG